MNSLFHQKSDVSGDAPIGEGFLSARVSPTSGSGEADADQMQFLLQHKDMVLKTLEKMSSEEVKQDGN